MNTTRTNGLTALVLATGLLLAGCGEDTENRPASGEAAPEVTSEQHSPTPTPTEEQAPTAISIAEGLKAEVSTVTNTTEVTEENDENELIGRPGQYIIATWIADKAADPQETGIDGGAVVEVFENAEDAQTRSDYIQDILKEAGPVFGTEYHYLKDNVLLRVSGKLAPSEAERYEKAFNEIAG